MNVVKHVHARHKAIRARGGIGFKLKRPGVIQFPKLIQIQYQRHLLEIMKRYKAFLISRIEAPIKAAIAQVQRNLPDNLKLDDDGDWNSMLNNAFDSASTEWNNNIFTPAMAEQVGTQQAKQISEFNHRQVVASVQKMVGFDVFIDQPWLAGQMKGFASANADLITKMTDDVKDQISALTFREVAAGSRWENIADQIQDRFKVGDSRAALIGRDQTNKFNGNLNKLRQSELGIEEYTWQGVMDERERDEHVALEGQTFKWSEPPEEGNPGEPINCRCWAEPVITLPNDNDSTGDELEQDSDVPDEIETADTLGVVKDATDDLEPDEAIKTSVDAFNDAPVDEAGIQNWREWHTYDYLTNEDFRNTADFMTAHSLSGVSEYTQKAVSQLLEQPLPLHLNRVRLNLKEPMDSVYTNREKESLAADQFADVSPKKDKIKLLNLPHGTWEDGAKAYIKTLKGVKPLTHEIYRGMGGLEAYNAAHQLKEGQKFDMTFPSSFTIRENQALDYATDYRANREGTRAHEVMFVMEKGGKAVSNIGLSRHPTEVEMVTMGKFKVNKITKEEVNHKVWSGKEVPADRITVHIEQIGI